MTGELVGLADGSASGVAVGNPGRFIGVGEAVGGAAFVEAVGSGTGDVLDAGSGEAGGAAVGSLCASARIIASVVGPITMERLLSEWSG